MAEAYYKQQAELYKDKYEQAQENFKAAQKKYDELCEQVKLFARTHTN